MEKTLHPNVQKALNTLKTTIDPITGKSAFDLKVEKTRKTMRTIDEETGLTFGQLNAKRTHSIMRNKIDVTSGKTKGELIIERENKRRIIFPDGTIIDKPNKMERTRWERVTIDPITGISLWNLRFQKKSVTMQKIDPITGVSIQQETTKKAQATLNQIVDETGQTRMERNWKNKNRLQRYKDSKLFFQSSYEFKWLELQVTQYGYEWVKENIKNGHLLRGETDLTYLPDFIIGNTIYEIKSNWTYNRRGKNIEMQQLHHTKWKLAEELGFKMIVILDSKEYNEWQEY